MQTKSLLLFLLIAASGCHKNTTTPPQPIPKQVPGSPWFRTLDASSGFNFEHSFGPQRRFWIPETVSGGVALLDHDGDGDLDIYCVQAGGDLGGDRSSAPTNRLFRNDGDLRFTDITEAAGVGDQGYGMGASCCDFDRDGDVDIFVSNVGKDVLYVNLGDGTFEDRSETAGIGDAGIAASAAFIDLDGDRYPELYVTRYVLWSPVKELSCGSGQGQDYCSPNNYQAPAPDLFYRNNGDGTFSSISESSGIRAAYGNGLGVVHGDFDGDGHIDLYVANDGSPNQLWMNRGDLRFEDIAVTEGCAVNLNGVPEAGMGVQAVDLDEDGDLDLFMTHIRNETNTWYRNDGGIFSDTTVLSRLGAASRDMTGFGMGFQDFNHDGFLDLFVVNGKVLRIDRPGFTGDPYAETDQLFKGLGSARFEEVFPQGGVSPELQYTGRGAAFGDLDLDGDQDVIVINNNGPAVILVNESEKAGGSVTIEVTDLDGVAAIGAMLRIHIGDRILLRQVERCYSYCSSSSPTVHVGLAGTAAIDRIEVKWIDGTTSEHGPYPAGSRSRIQQPR